MSELAKGAVRADVLGGGSALTPFAASLAHVPYTRIRELGELAVSMDGALRLYFGESNLPTPKFIVIPYSSCSRSRRATA